MSGTVARGLQQAGERDENLKQTTNSELSPERHDSKANTVSSGLSQDTSTGSDHPEAETSWNQHAAAQNASALHGLDYAVAQTHLSQQYPNHPLSGLHIETNIERTSQAGAARFTETPTIYETSASDSTGTQHEVAISGAASTGSLLRTTLSTSSMASNGSHGSASALTSPYLAALSDLTPLPSPRSSTDLTRSGSWKKSFGRPTTPRSRGGSMEEADSSGNHNQPQTSPFSSAKKRKGYGSLLQGAVENAAAGAEDPSRMESGGHGRNRSISDFVPEQLQNVRPRPVTMGPGDTANLETHSRGMHREACLATKRGLTGSVDPKTREQQLPTPPASLSSVGESDEADDEIPHLEDGSAAEDLEIHCGMHNKRRKFRQLRQLGQGTFSKVMLATRERIPAYPTPEIEEHLDPHKLVAVKIVEQGPAGGADEQRIETGLKREVEMLKSLSHPSLIHLKACEYHQSRALIVLTYCPGGDLFEMASEKRTLLTPLMIQRIFSELVHAVRYLHSNWIVHRDIKLENVLVNLRTLALEEITDPRAHPTPIVTLTDLGLSRRIPQPPESPLLTTRCGSEDYAAPEILLGQAYDGRLTDGWALGVLLFALMEGRLPFDAPPGKPERSRNTHRIARCDWIWCRFGNEDGDWDGSKGGEFEGARGCVEGLLRKIRSPRKSLWEIEGMDWVQNGVRVAGGLTRRDEDEDDALL